MKILLVASYFPYPLYSGGQVRLYNLLRNLGKRHKITLICEVRQKVEESELKELKKYCRQIFTVTRPKQWSIPNILRAGFSSYPFLLVGHRNKQMTDIVNEELKKENYDLVHVETFYVMHNLSDKVTIPIVLAEHNIEWKIYKHWVDGFWCWPLKPLLYLDVLKMFFWERYFWQKANKVVVVSNLDQKEIEKATKKEVVIIPNGVDCDYFGEVTKTEPQKQTVVFVGSFTWMQNRDAVSYLLQKIWPKIAKEVYNAKLWIIGNNALKFIRKKDKNTIIEEDVADIRKVYATSTVLLAPIRLGGGTKFKILESMAAGLPVVTTPKGVEGLGADTNGIRVGETEDELITYTLELLQDKNKRAEISLKEKEFIRKNFDWKDISKKLEKVYENSH